MRVGQNVTFVLKNTGQLDHELMIGRNLTNHPEGRSSGCAQDFFNIAGVSPSIAGGGMIMDHGDGPSEDAMQGMDHGEGAAIECMDQSEDADEAEVGMGGVMMIIQPVGRDSSAVTFTVTKDMQGEWEIGCFPLDGVHYTSGMLGTLSVSE